MKNQQEHEEMLLVEELMLTIALVEVIEMFRPAPQYIRGTPKIGRNDVCPCGSHKKYKKCCEPQA
jgi:uncharacterized protein YecA (UPF0149 family)